MQSAETVLRCPQDNLQVVCAYSSETDGSVGGVQWLELTVCLKARGSQQI